MECDWDTVGSAADCYFCGAACVGLMGNGICDSECYIGACNLDGGDCNVCGDNGCLTSQIGDGVCQKECFNFGCDYDDGDCYQCADSPTCSPRFIGDGNCDPQCYHPGCNFDGGDCETVCDTNAFGTCKIWMTMVSRRPSTASRASW